jgi:hypothetical protein
LVRPREFFIAWQGVPTLAYEGFTETLLSIKQELKTQIPGLIIENPGSLWPKTTLGALNDTKKLSLEDTYKLKQICNKFHSEIIKIEPFKITMLSIVLFQCRSLEKRLLTGLKTLVQAMHFSARL